ncbi:Rne/Rng family ribonuclease [Geobacter pelophilus]|uniref:Ribonuclease G n=1 Tax=Geoanaerobacter pelophilus TaxID=60036 RepID=A0AAW4KY75_9BACT|nr:Rne/Rng family ribonuclease [Geoanaerobacter pelophilus]MBT0663508.1 Rne/Rng family ribonuclease [Geoanaerobacter pelophilus]
MSKKMLINVMHPEEARVAIVQDGRLMELDIEIAGSEQTRGNVYKGVVVRVEPALQAAFVDIGLKRLAFMQMGELHPDYWQWRDDILEDQRKRRPRIQEVLRRGQELIVQVEKGERDMKGAAVTTYMSFPGRYMVLMPGSDSAGISRKVEGEGERKKLKEAIAEMEIPEGIGYIVRTEAVGKTKTELKKDLQYLLKLYQGILDKGATVKAPALIAEETDLVTRTIRDYFTAEIDEVLVDSQAHHKQIKAFFKATMPKFEKLVKMHQEKRPIFSKYQLEEQIDLIYEKKVPLPSGGSLVIEPTEALVSIDVNSGKTTGERGVEDTAFKTNMEAAEEVARQLRLRDLGGLIVIDFIDMRDRKHMAEVEKVLKNALKLDKARVTVGKISQFGMLEMSRQRIKQTIEQAIHLECPHCSGRGKVKSVEAVALSFLRKVHGAAAKGTAAEIRGGLPLEVAYYLLNRKKRELVGIENDYDISVTVKGKTSFLMNQVELEVIKRDKPLHEERSHAEEVELKPAAAEVKKEESQEHGEPQTEEAKAKKKRKRSRKKKHPEGSEAAIAAESSEQSEIAEEEPLASVEADEDALHEEPVAAEAEGGESGEHADGKKKRRRRRKKKKSGGVAGEVAADAESGGQGEVAETEPEEAAATDEEPAAAESEESHAAGEAKKKRRRRRRKPKAAGESGGEELPVSQPEEPVAVAVAEPAPAEEPAKKPAKPRRSPRKKAEPVEAAPEVAVVPEVAAVAVEQAAPAAKKAAKPRRTTKKAVVEAEPAAEPVEKPKTARKPRAKKKPATEE